MRANLSLLFALGVFPLNITPAWSQEQPKQEPAVPAPQPAAQVVTKYFHLDAVGNVRVIADEAGNVIERYDYLPFGEEWNAQPSDQPLRFTGKERDQETGFDYFGARYYGSPFARFTTPDPITAWKQNLQDPQRWNRYAYALNNPFRYSDPDGRCAAPAGIGGGVGFCVEAFIASATIGGVGLGDNRAFSATDGSLSYRARVQFVVDPATGDVRDFVQEAGTSSVFLPGVGAFGRQGTVHANIINKERTEEGDTKFTLNLLALNGLAFLPLAPKDPIDLNLNFVVTREGNVSLAPGSTQTGYPSVGAYAYTVGGRKATTIHEQQEGKPSDLGAPKVQVPERRPK